MPTIARPPAVCAAGGTARCTGTSRRRAAFPRTPAGRDTVSRDRFEPDDHPSRPLPPRLDPRAGRPSRSTEPRDSARAPRQRSRRGPLVVRIVGALLSAALLASSGWGWYLGQVADASVTRTDAIPSTGNDNASH